MSDLNHRYYACNGGSDNDIKLGADRKRCRVGYLRSDPLDAAVWRIVADRIRNADETLEELRAATRAADQQAASSGGRKAIITRQIAEQRAARQEITNALRAGSLIRRSRGGLGAQRQGDRRARGDAGSALELGRGGGGG